MLPPDTCEGDGELPQFNVSYKPQKISPKFEGTVRQLLHKKIRDAYLHPQFVSDVMKPLTIDPLMDQEVQNLSGGELQVSGVLGGERSGREAASFIFGNGLCLWRGEAREGAGGLGTPLPGAWLAFGPFSATSSSTINPLLHPLPLSPACCQCPVPGPGG